MAKLTHQGFIDDGTNSLSIDGTLSVHGGTTITNLNATYNVVQKTSNYTIVSTDYMVDCTGTFNITLPAASSVSGKEFVIKNSGSGSITILTSDSNLIDDNASGDIILIQYESLSVYSNGSNWVIT